MKRVRGNMTMSKDEYLITDAPLKALTVFAMPMILGSFFQQVYNMADSIIVGQFVGSSALAAVGACAALTNVFICVALGAGVGAGVLVSRYFGAKEYGKMKTIVSTSLISFLLLSIILGDRGHHHCGLGGGAEHLPDQDRRTQPHRACGKVQPAAAHRGAAGRQRRLPRHGCLQREALTQTLRQERQSRLCRSWRSFLSFPCQFV